MLKKIGFLVVLIVLFLSTKNVYASIYEDKVNEHGMWISNEYVTKEKNGIKKYQQMTKIVRNSDGRFLYCIEPGKSIDENEIFTGYDDNQKDYANLSEEKWNKIKLLAYYGYGYKDDYYDHTDIKWYVVTQYMIWQVNNLDYDIYFTNTLNGNRIVKYTNEMSELENIVNNHYIVPNFNTNYLDVFLGSDTSFVDTNTVLSKFSVTSNTLNVRTNGNSLIVNNNNENNMFGSINFVKNNNFYNNNPVVYVSSNSQNLLLPGNVEDVVLKKEITTTYGTIIIYKVDHDTSLSTPQGSASLENALYGLYDNNSNLIEEKRTDKSGNIRFNKKLKEGRYYVQELEASNGYLIDSNKYYLDITRNSPAISITLKEKVIKENYEITKLYKDDNIMKAESNIEFGIYDESNNLIEKYKTNNYGKIAFELPYGKYKLKQLSVYDGYEMIDDYKIYVKDSKKVNILTFVDNKIKYKVNLNVSDKNTKEKIEGIEFEIYDKDHRKICSDSRCTYKTDKFGNILFYGYYNEGEYAIKLVNSKNYDYESDTIKFTLNKNTEYKKKDGYRLVELYYYLSRHRKEENNISKIDENKEVNIDEKEDKNDNVISYIELDENNNIKDEYTGDVMEVSVPNTLKNSNNICYMFLLGIYIIKKLLS
ncbi:MAG: hypothetical protein E7158_02585 [Firmicutes bacterium]|nr:hypothetical protein [Bacillota bacterium]